MITLFEDINENTNRVARNSHSSATPIVTNTHMSWHERIISWFSSRLHTKNNVNMKEDPAEPHSDINDDKIKPGQEEFPLFAAEINR